MKKIKLFSLVAATLFAGSAMAATSYIPQGVKEVTENVVVYASDITSAGDATKDWVVVPAFGTETKTYTNTNGDTKGNPNSVTDNLATASNATMIKIKTDGNCYNSSKRVVHMHVKGVGKIIGHGYGKADRGMAIAYKEYTVGMSEATFATDVVSVTRTSSEGSYIVELDGLEATKEYIVSFYATGSDNDFYAAELFVGTPCTDAGLLLAENPDIEVNEGEELVAPALTNPKKVVVTYASSDESVVKVAADGTLTSVGAGDAVITISAALQTVGDVLYCADELTYNVKIKSLSPVLEATESALDFSLNAFETTKSATFTVSGYNLTGEASVSTLPAGFTLDPATLTITDGAIDQAFKLTYTAEAAVEASNANLVFTVGTTSVTITLTYGKIAALTQTIVTDSTTWNWSKAGVKEVLLSDATTPTKNDTIVLANIDGIANDANFNSQALLVRGQYMVRDSKYFQGDYISFNVENAGTVQVVFSNTGDRKGDKTLTRYLYVNGQATTFGSGVTNANTTSDEIAVPAGKVEITFMLPDESKGNQFGRVYSITFVPKETGTALEQNSLFVPATKVIRNGQLLIIREGKTYTVQGVEVK